ncbi:hypothetical protein EP7_004978 [Isosphaeraceae bacterium EP7]
MRTMPVIWAELTKAEDALKNSKLTDAARAEIQARLDGLREEMTAALLASAAEEEALGLAGAEEDGPDEAVEAPGKNGFSRLKSDD